jgi:hypothetical protein
METFLNDISGSDIVGYYLSPDRQAHAFMIAGRELAAPSGDMDTDGDTDFDDIDDFLLGLNAACDYLEMYDILPEVRGDVDRSGLLDFDDIPGFVGAIKADNSPQAAPEPSAHSLSVLGLLSFLWRFFTQKKEADNTYTFAGQCGKMEHCRTHSDHAAPSTSGGWTPRRLAKILKKGGKHLFSEESFHEREV